MLTLRAKNWGLYKMEKIIVSPSILSADFANLESEIQKVTDAGADWIHVDVMDGHFVPNITIGVPVVKSLKRISKLPLDVHLMIENPQKYVEALANSGADILTFHYEAVKKNEIKPLIEQIKALDVKVGMSIKPKTDPKEILDILDDLDLVLIMTVEPGFGGQKYISECSEKIKIIKEKAKPDLIIQVDGGINEETGEICKKFGANSLVAGNYIYKSDDIKKAVTALKS